MYTFKYKNKECKILIAIRNRRKRWKVIIEGRRLPGTSMTAEEAKLRAKLYVDKNFSEEGTLDTPIYKLTWYQKLWVVPTNRLLEKLINLINKIGRWFE